MHLKINRKIYWKKSIETEIKFLETPSANTCNDLPVSKVHLYPLDPLPQLEKEKGKKHSINHAIKHSLKKYKLKIDWIAVKNEQIREKETYLQPILTVLFSFFIRFHARQSSGHSPE